MYYTAKVSFGRGWASYSNDTSKTFGSTWLLKSASLDGKLTSENLCDCDSSKLNGFNFFLYQTSSESYSEDFMLWV